MALAIFTGSPLAGAGEFASKLRAAGFRLQVVNSPGMHQALTGE